MLTDTVLTQAQRPEGTKICCIRVVVSSTYANASPWHASIYLQISKSGPVDSGNDKLFLLVTPDTIKAGRKAKGIITQSWLKEKY